MPKYTFLLPAYKAAFLDKALISIRNQTYSDFCCLVSDDCSPENLKSIFDDTVGNDPRFVFRRNSENLGGKDLVAHWNLLVNMCQTEYFVLASDDDLYDNQFLEQIDALNEIYPQVNLYRARGRRIYKDEKLLLEDYLWPEYESSLRFTFDMYSTYYLHCIANYVFRTSSMQSRGGFISFPLAWFSDDATVLRESDKGVVNTRDILFSFRYSCLNISDKIGESKECSWQKFLACVKFDEWMVAHLKRFENNLKQGEHAYWKVSTWGVRGKIEEQVNVCIPNLTKTEFVYAYKWLVRRGYVEGLIKKIQLVRHWFHGK